MIEPTKEEIIEMKKTWKGKWKLYKMGLNKFKSDPPIYRVHLLQGLMTKLTIYMIIFAAVYAVSVGFWVFALIIIPVGTVGNYYAAKAHFMKYKDSVRQYELAGILVPIKDDVSNIRRRWRTIEKKMGFFGVDIIFTLFLVVLSIAYFGNFSLYQKFGIVFASFVPMFLIYFEMFYGLCREDEDED